MRRLLSRVLITAIAVQLAGCGSFDAQGGLLLPYFLSLVSSGESAPGVSLSKTELTVSEGNRSDSYTMVLNTAPESEITVDLTAGAQVSITPQQVVFTTDNWNTAQTINVTAVDDADVESDPHTDTITHTISTADSEYSNEIVSDVPVSINDDEMVVRGEVTMNTTTRSISTGLEEETRTFVLCSVRSNNSNQRIVPTCQMNGDSVQIAVELADNQVVSYQAVRLPEHQGRVGRGSYQFGGNNIDQSIDLSALAEPLSFEPGRSFVILTARNNNNTNANDEERTVTGQLTDATTLRLQRNEGNPGKNTDVEYQIVELASGAVTVGQSSYADASTTTTASFSAVDTTSTALVYSVRAHSGANGIDGDYLTGGQLTSSTQATFTRRPTATGSPTGSPDVVYHVVEFPADWSVIHPGGALSGPASTATVSDTIASVETNRSFILHGSTMNNSTDGDLDAASWTESFSSDTGVLFTRISTSQPSDVTYQVVSIPRP